MILTEALERLAEIEKDLTIDDPQMQVNQAFAYPPTGRAAIPAPAWVNIWRLESVEYLPNDRSRASYVLRPQMFVGAVEQNSNGVLSKAAALFHQAFLEAMESNIGLGSSDRFHSLSGTTGGDTLTVLNWNGIDYIGLDYEISLQADVVAAERGL